MNGNLSKEELVEDTDKRVKVIDRRHFTFDGERRELKEEEMSSRHAVNDPIEKAPEPKKDPPVSIDSFKELVLFLVQNALAALGQLPDPRGRKTEINIEAASTMIEWLDSLEKKTKNNLSAEEKQLMDEYLYQLKMLFIKAKQGEKL
jgi:hypothetical protein